MKRIESFSVDHEKLQKGVYVSRTDKFGDTILTTFDIRMKKPNVDAVLGTGDIHAIEHLGATFLRNHERYSSHTVYFGPMGCRTGFYLILEGSYQSRDIIPLLKDLFQFIKDFTDAVPGASPVECGNYSDIDLEAARNEAAEFYDLLRDIPKENLNYPS